MKTKEEDAKIKELLPCLQRAWNIAVPTANLELVYDELPENVVAIAFGHPFDISVRSDSLIATIYDVNNALYDKML